MDKKIKSKNLIIIGIILIFSITILLLVTKDTYSTSATTENLGKVKITCDKTNVLPSETLTCAIKGENFTTAISSFRTKIILDNNLSLESIEKDDIWEGSGEGGIIDLYTDVNKSGNFNIAVFTVKATNIQTGLNSNILLQDTVISDQNFDEYNIENPSLNIRIQSTINTLSSLTITGLNFNFDKDTTTYNLTTELSEVTINATSTDQKSTITGDVGTKPIKVGTNNFAITVTSESGAKKVYTLIITRPEKLIFSQDIGVNEDEMTLEFDSSELLVDDILNKIETTGTITITDKSGKVPNNDTFIGTGYKLNIQLSTKKNEYNIIVLGDTNGDGQITVTDVSKLFQHYRKNITMENIYIKAGDVKYDNEIKLPDVAKLFQYVRGNIENLKDK